MQFVAIHQVQIFAVLTTDHRVPPADLSGKQRHPLVLNFAAVERADLETAEVVGLHQLRERHRSVVRGVGRVISGPAVLDVFDEPCVLDSVGFVRRIGKDAMLGDVLAIVALDLVVRLGERHHLAAAMLPRRRHRSVATQHRLDRRFELSQREPVVQLAHDAFGQAVVDA